MYSSTAIPKASPTNQGSSKRKKRSEKYGPTLFTSMEYARSWSGSTVLHCSSKVWASVVGSIWGSSLRVSLLGHWERSRAHASHSHSLSFFVAFSAMWPIIVDTAEDDRQDGRGVCVGRDGKGWEGMGRDGKGCGRLWPVHTYSTVLVCILVRCSIGIQHHSLQRAMLWSKYDTKRITSTDSTVLPVILELSRHSSTRVLQNSVPHKTNTTAIPHTSIPSIPLPFPQPRPSLMNRPAHPSPSPQSHTSQLPPIPV